MCTMPAMSSPVFMGLSDATARFQSLGLEPETATLMTTSSGPGEGMGESTTLTVRSELTRASFILKIVLINQRDLN